MSLIVYGRLPLMITRNCPVRNQLGSCKACPHSLRDRTGRLNPVYCTEKKEYTEIFNSEKIFLADKKIPENVSHMVFHFTDEPAEEIEKVYRAYTEKTGYKPKNITNGLYFRGVE